MGKTRLLACLVNAARALGQVAVYTTTADLMDYLRAGYNPETKEALTYDDRFDLLKNCRLLCLDEFDRWHTTEWAMEKFTQLINWRYERGAELMTAFAANCTLEDLPGYVASRMQDRKNYVYVLDGADVRRLKTGGLMSKDTSEKLAAWAIVELFGHTRIAGHVSEYVLGGSSFVRIDVPEVGDTPAFTRLYGAGAIYSITFTDEETARAAVGVLSPCPLTVYIPAARALTAGDEELPF